MPEAPRCSAIRCFFDLPNVRFSVTDRYTISLPWCVWKIRQSRENHVVFIFCTFLLNPLRSVIKGPFSGRHHDIPDIGSVVFPFFSEFFFSYQKLWKKIEILFSRNSLPWKIRKKRPEGKILIFSFSKKYLIFLPTFFFGQCSIL